MLIADSESALVNTAIDMELDVGPLFVIERWSVLSLPKTNLFTQPMVMTDLLPTTHQHDVTDRPIVAVAVIRGLVYDEG